MKLFQRKKHCFILSVDAGGYGSMIPCIILEKMQEELRMQGSAKSLADCFDVVIGSGSGAITATLVLFINKETQLQRSKGSGISHIMKKMIDHMYDPTEHYFFKRVEEVEKIISIKQRYLEPIIREYFYKTKLLGSSPKPLLVPVLDTEKNNIMVISSVDAYSMDIAELLWLANKYYFLQHNNMQHVESVIHAKVKYLTNAILSEKNPALLAIEWLQKKYPDNTNYHVLSLGTGILPSIYPVFDITQHLLYNSIRSQIIAVERSIFLQSNIHYYRIDGVWKQKNDDFTMQTNEQIKQSYEELSYDIVYKSIPIIRNYVNKVLG